MMDLPKCRHPLSVRCRHCSIQAILPAMSPFVVSRVRSLFFKNTRIGRHCTLFFLIFFSVIFRYLPSFWDRVRIRWISRRKNASNTTNGNRKVLIFPGTFAFLLYELQSYVQTRIKKFLLCHLNYRLWAIDSRIRLASNPTLHKNRRVWNFNILITCNYSMR